MNFGFLRLILHRVTDIIKHFLKKLFFVRYPYFPIVHCRNVNILLTAEKERREANEDGMDVDDKIKPVRHFNEDEAAQIVT